MTSDEPSLREPVDSPSDDTDNHEVAVEENYDADCCVIKQVLADFYAD